MNKLLKNKVILSLIVLSAVVCAAIFAFKAPTLFQQENKSAQILNKKTGIVYLAPRSGGIISKRILSKHPEVTVVNDYETLEDKISKRIVTIWIDKSAVELLPKRWIFGTPQNYYPIILIGVGNEAEMADKLGIPIFGIPFAAFRNRNENGFSVWLLTSKDDNGSIASVWKGYPGRININHLLNTSANLMKKRLSTVKYENARYGFSFYLPLDWKGYKIIQSEWKGEAAKGNAEIPLSGPIITIRNPHWSTQKPMQDIPIMVFTRKQWEALQSGQFLIGTAPVKPTELGRNEKFVFALPPQYNSVHLAGYEEVNEILANNPLKTKESSKK